MFRRTACRSLLIVLVLSMLLGPATRLAKQNARSLAWLGDSIHPALVALADGLCQRCQLARQHYGAGEYQDNVDVLFEEWMAAPVGAQRMAQCRWAAVELAVSLRHLGRDEDEAEVYRRIVESSPGMRDQVMYYALLGVGNAALESGDWREAQLRYVAAYDIAVLFSWSDGTRDEERVWSRLTSLVKFVSDNGCADEALAHWQLTAAQVRSSQGWHVLAGILYEESCHTDSALEAYRAAQGAAPGGRYLAQHLTALQSGELLCVP